MASIRIILTFSVHDGSAVKKIKCSPLSRCLVTDMDGHHVCDARSKICQKNIRLVSSYASRNAAAASLQVGYHYINQSAQSQSPSTLTPTRGLPPPVINQKCMSAQCVAQPIHDMEVPRSQKHKGKRKTTKKNGTPWPSASSANSPPLFVSSPGMSYGGVRPFVRLALAGVRPRRGSSRVPCSGFELVALRSGRERGGRSR